MRKRVKSFNLGFSKTPHLNIPIMRKSKYIPVKNTGASKVEVNPLVAKWTFVFLMVLIFFALFYSNPSITSYSVLETVNPGANFIIFFGLLALIFFLTYEKRKISKK